MLRHGNSYSWLSAFGRGGHSKNGGKASHNFHVNIADSYSIDYRPKALVKFLDLHGGEQGPAKHMAQYL